MEQYIFPLLCLLLNFISVVVCVRFLCSKEGFYWIFPLLFSLLLLFQNIRTTFLAGTTVLTTSNRLSTIISLFWCMVIILFHLALGKTHKQNRYEQQVRRNLQESRYQMRIDQKEHDWVLKQRNIDALGKAVDIKLNLYDDEWVAYFDQF
ncbi:MAG: hypothetical protein WCR02_02445 [Sphaerochaetaceae bacterium]